jgi:aminopeptidase N
MRALFQQQRLSLAISAALLLATLPALANSPTEREVLPAGANPQVYQLTIDPDLDKLTFQGELTLQFTASQALPELVLNALDLTVIDASIDGKTVVAEVVPATQRVHFKAPLSPGKHLLKVRYHGKIYEQSAGLFATDYTKADGSKGRMLSSQFEPGDARKLAPMWDEPAHKAIFNISIIEPKGQMAISNMPEKQRQPLPDGRARVDFAPSVKMSSYLLYVGAGDYERISGRSGGIEHGVVAKKGDAVKGSYALNASYQLLDYFNDYFGIDYSLPKLDHIAVPGAGGFGAMENWGAVMYFEDTLLLDPKFSTTSNKQNVYAVVAHEMAHQWFGNIVTMQWWDDLWLNEGFASWMESKASQKFNPAWQVELSAVASRNYAMAQDAQQTTHPVVQPVRNLEEANAAFDGITYAKGLSVITMLEAYLGEEAFRTGVRAYMQQHQYNNTVTNDLWQALAKASGRPVETIAKDFTHQSGVPLIEVLSAECQQGSTKLTLKQSRFGLDEVSKKPQQWTVPVTAQVLGSAVGRAEIRGAAPQHMTLPGCGAVTVNAGQTGYYRVQYSDALLQQLTRQFANLAAVDQLGLLKDSQALSYASYTSLQQFLSLLQQVPADANPMIAVEVVGQLNGLAYMYEGLPGEAAFKRWALQKAQAMFSKVGWEKQPTESDNTSILRSTLIRTLANLGDAAVLAEARRRFAVRHHATSPDENALPGDLYSVVLGVIGKNANADDFATLKALAVASKNSTEKRRLLAALASVKDVQLAKAALELSLTDLTPKQWAPDLLNRVADEHTELAYQFYLQHQPAFDDRLDPLRRNGFDASILGSGRDAKTAALLQQKAAAASSKPVKTAYQQAAAGIERLLERINRIPPQVDSFLQMQKI